MTSKGDLFTSMKNSFNYNINIGDDNALTLEYMGSMEINNKEGTKKVNIIYYTLNLKHNLLSVGQIM